MSVSLAKTGLTLTQVCVRATIGHSAGAQADYNDVAWTLVVELGMDELDVKRTLAELATMGLIRRIQTRMAIGDGLYAHFETLVRVR